MPREPSLPSSSSATPHPYSRPAPQTQPPPTPSTTEAAAILQAAAGAQPQPHLVATAANTSPIQVPATAAGQGQQQAMPAPSGKRPGACAECKRLKLGCDRVWPCSSCKRRKVAHLCPEGQLESKEINLAQKQIKGLLDRIGALERTLTENEVDFEPFNPRDDPTFNFDVVPALTASLSESSPPGEKGGKGKGKGKGGVGGVGAGGVGGTSGVGSLGSGDELMTSPEMGAGAGDDYRSQPAAGGAAGGAAAGGKAKGKGTLRVDAEGVNRFTGGQASAEHAIPMRRFRSTCIPDPADDEIAPFLESMPGEREARIYIHNYFVNCDWMHRLLEEDQFMRDWGAYFNDPRPPIQRMPRHKIAVGLLVIALGYISDLGPHDPLDRPDSWVKGAQLCLGGLGVGFTVGVTLDTVAGLNLLAQYMLNADARESASAAWNVIGIALRLCQSMGLHYSGAWDEPEISYRQRLWWETIAMDRILSLSLGRPYMARSSQTVWPIVLDSYGYVREGVKRSFAVSDFTQPSSLPFHWFKYRLCIILDQCLNDLDSPYLPRPSVVQKVHNALGEIVKELPPFLVPPHENDDQDPFRGLGGMPEQEQQKIVAQAHMFHLLVQMTGLAIHRPFFMEEIKKTQEPAGLSFDACVLSARKLTACLRSCKRWMPKLSRFWKSFVGETFTAAVVQATTVIGAPTTNQATAAWTDFRDTHDLFHRYADEGHSTATRTVPTLDALFQDTADFVPATSSTLAATGQPPSRKQLNDGTIVTQSGINLNSLLHTSSRFFPPHAAETDVAEVQRHSKPAWLQVSPPEPGMYPPGPPDPSQRVPGATAARYATGRFDGPHTDWQAATQDYETSNLGPSDSVIPTDMLGHFSAQQRNDYTRLSFPPTSTYPSTSHVRRHTGSSPPAPQPPDQRHQQLHGMPGPMRSPPQPSSNGHMPTYQTYDHPHGLGISSPHAPPTPHFSAPAPPPPPTGYPPVDTTGWPTADTRSPPPPPPQAMPQRVSSAPHSHGAPDPYGQLLASAAVMGGTAAAVGPGTSAGPDVTMG